MSKLKNILYMDVTGDRVQKFPELGEIDDESRRTQIFMYAKNAVAKKQSFPMLVRLVFVLLCLVFVLSMTTLGTKSGTMPVLAFVGGPIWLGLEIWLYFWTIPRIRDEIREWIDTRESFCRKCDYSLWGNISGRCPECGAEIPNDQRKRIEARTAFDLDIASP